MTGVELVEVVGGLVEVVVDGVVVVDLAGGAVVDVVVVVFGVVVALPLAALALAVAAALASAALASAALSLDLASRAAFLLAGVALECRRASTAMTADLAWVASAFWVWATTDAGAFFVTSALRASTRRMSVSRRVTLLVEPSALAWASQPWSLTNRFEYRASRPPWPRSHLRACRQS